MKRIHFSCVAVVLLTTGTVTADLMVYEYVLGQPVTSGTSTGNCGYWNLEDFVKKTYAKQISANAGLRTYGNTAGGWQMETYQDMHALWTYLADLVTAPFGPSLLESSYTSHLSRYDYPTPPSATQSLGPVYITFSPKGPLGSAELALMVRSIPNTLANHAIGAWGTGTGNDWPVVVTAGRKPTAPQALRTKLYLDPH